MRPLRYALLALAFAVAPLAQAQVLPSFGLTGGLNFGSLSDAAGAKLDQSTGYHVGVFGDVNLLALGARVALLYVKAGDIGIGPDDLSVTFIAVPVDLKYQFPSPLVKPYALLGPEFRFATGDLSDADARSLNLAINAGLGAELSALIGPKVFAELRYALDVTGFAGDTFSGVPTDDSFKVSAFFLRLGIGL